MSETDRKPTRARWLRSGLAAGVIGAAAVAPVDVALGLARGGTSGFGGGALNVIVADLWFGAVVGVLLGFAAWCLARPPELSRVATALFRGIGSIARAADPDREPTRLAVLAGTVVFAASLFGLSRAMLSGAIGGVRTNLLAAIPTALTVPLCALVAAAAGAFVGLLCYRVATRLPRGARRWLNTRTALVAGAVAVLAAAVVLRQPLAQFSRAFDPLPLAMAAATAVVIALLLLSSYTDGRVGVRISRWSTGRRAIGVAIALVVALATIASYVGQFGPPVRTYRAHAPLSSLAVPLLARALDFDRDGYSAIFGDGDCAAFDGARNPGARDIPGNGVDEDCFDGDQTAAALPTPPPPYPVPVAVPERLSFVVVLVDAIRYDHLSLAGYERKTTPKLDAFAERAVVFERAYSPSSYTFPSMTAIATSKLPSMLPDGVMRKKAGLANTETTLSTLLRDAGYRTTLVSDYGNVLIKTNVSLGFDDVKRLYDDAPRAIKLATGAIDAAGDDPFLVWISLVGPHNPYRRNAGAPNFGDDFIDLYDHELAAIDNALATLTAHIESSTQSGRTAIAIISDHGEAFGEHGTYYHGHNLHAENVHVPWILSVPGIAPARFGAEPVSLLDLTPTLINLARIEVPAHMVGHDQTRALASGEQPAGRSVFIESDFVGYGVDTGYAAALVTSSHKLMVQGGGRTVRLYDIQKDPGETRDVAAAKPDVTRDMRRLLKRYQSFGVQARRK